MEEMNLKLEELDQYFAGIENIISDWIIGSYGTAPPLGIALATIIAKK